MKHPKPFRPGDRIDLGLRDGQTWTLQLRRAGPPGCMGWVLRVADQVVASARPSRDPHDALASAMITMTEVHWTSTGHTVRLGAQSVPV